MTAQPVERRSLLDSEDGTHDDLERDRLHLAVDGKRTSHGPGVDPPIGDLAHDLAVGLHPLAVEGRKHQAALTQVALAVEDEYRVPPENGLE